MVPQLLTVITLEKLKTWTPDEWAKWWIEPKYDGARCIYHNGQFLSRTGKPLHNLKHIAAELEREGLSGWTLDGEIYGRDWAATMSVARSSKTEKPKNGLRFAVFDAMWDDQWDAGVNTEPLSIRRCDVIRLVDGLQYIHPVTPVQVDCYARFATIHKNNLDWGCDGTVLKLADSPYEFKRTKTWLKVKPVETFDGVVIGMKEGTGKYKGMCGALEVALEDGKVSTFVSGMDDEMRLRWWQDRGDEQFDVIGKTIEIVARGVHKSGRLIEPRFIRIREDK